VNIIDALGNKFKVTEDLSGRHKSIIVENFKLPDETVLGDWKVEVIVERQQIKMKSFGVQKYVLPPFEVFIEPSKKHYAKEENIQLTFYGRYSFEEYVKGSYTITVIQKTNDLSREVYSKSGYNEGKIETFKFIDKKFPESVEYLEYEVIASLNETVTQIVSKSNATFFIHKEQNYKIIVDHPKQMLPGLPFRIKVKIFKWDGYPLDRNGEKLNVKINRISGINLNNQIAHDPEIINGIAIFDIETTKNHVAIEMEISFLNSKVYRFKAEKGNQNVAVDGLAVTHLPERYVVFYLHKLN
jgi:hypothetical protein